MPELSARRARVRLSQGRTRRGQRCGSGGTVRDGVIEVQGDHRDVIVATLVKLGWPAKKSGG